MHPDIIISTPLRDPNLVKQPMADFCIKLVIKNGLTNKISVRTDRLGRRRNAKAAFESRFLKVIKNLLRRIFLGATREPPEMLGIVASRKHLTGPINHLRV